LRNLLFVLLSVFLLVACIALLLRHYLRARKATQATWDSLLKQLTWVDRDKIEKIALDVIAESGERRQDEHGFALDPSAIWTILGGLDGLLVLERNCHILVELACYLQKSYPEALVIAEQLRLNAKEIEWHVARLRGAAKTGNLQSSFADYAQRAVVTYYLMTRHVLALYDQADYPRLADLHQAI
jgi:hypothetical protein